MEEGEAMSDEGRDERINDAMERILGPEMSSSCSYWNYSGGSLTLDGSYTPDMLCAIDSALTLALSEEEMRARERPTVVPL